MSALKLSFIIEAIDRATAPIRAINRMLESTTGPISRINKSWGNLSGQVRGIATNFTLMTGAAAGAFYPLHQVIGEGSRIHNFSKMLSIGTTEFQRLAYAITQDGGSIEDGAHALTFFQQNAVHAATGNQEMAEWFRRAGMSVEFLRANVNKAGGVQIMLEKFADGMKGLAGPFQLDLSRSVLGKSGPRLLQTLANGAKGLKAAGDEAASLGIIIDPADIVKMNQAGISMQKIWRVLNSLTAVIATAAIPLIEKVTEAVIEWGKANRGLTLERWTRIFSQLEEGLPKIIRAVVQLAAVLGAVFGFLNTFAEFLGGWDKIIIGLVGVKFLMLIGAVVQLGAAVLGVVPAIVAFGVAFAAPIAAVLALAAAAYLIYRNWKPISEFFTDLWAGIKSAFGAAIEWISAKISALTGLVANAIVQLNALQPEWMKRFTLPGAALNALAGAVAPAVAPQTVPGGTAAAQAGRAQQANIGGTLKIEIDQKGRARVTELRSENRDALDFEVYLGPLILSP